jgi:hypothetical protein
VSRNPSKTIVSGVVVEREEPLPWKRWAAWTVGGLLLVGLVIGLFVWSPWSTEPPRLNEPPAKVAKFTISPDLAELPFERQLVYYKRVDDTEKELVEAYRTGQLTEGEYAAALQAAYIGRHLSRMENYHERRTPKDRDAYLDRLLEKRDAEKRGVAWTKKDGTKEVLSPDAKDADDVKHVKRDSSTEAATVQSWPAEVQKQWAEYHQAWEERKRLKRERGDAAGQPGQPRGGGN